MSKKSWNNGTRELEKIAGAVMFSEGYDPNDPAYNRTPKKQAEIDKEIAGFNKRTEQYHEENPYADPLRKYRLKRFRGDDVEDNEQPGDEFFEILDDVRMVVDTNDLEALVAGVAVKIGRKLTDLEKAWVEEQIQDDELSEDNETFAKIDQDASNGLGKAELVEIYGADAVEAYIKDGVAKGKFEGDLEY